ncbi:blue copper protein-like [Arachis ipaensis]|uniref:blue copper protein-like n=1 Tax=Arachis ipaensis TaxID=130454 RepID=UPI000A2B7B34|nr:blue copper protein-like [Arachis ipaensis]
MALVVERAMVLLMVMAVAYGAVYKVGDSAGWTTLGNIDYRKWSAPKNFQIGDTISKSLTTFTTGNDTIKITNYGHHFFFCGVPGHCQAGQKVDINVLRVSAGAPEPSALASPAVSTGGSVPAPSPSNADAPFIALKGPFGIITGLGMALFALA